MPGDQLTALRGDDYVQWKKHCGPRNKPARKVKIRCTQSRAYEKQKPSGSQPVECTSNERDCRHSPHKQRHKSVREPRADRFAVPYENRNEARLQRAKQNSRKKIWQCDNNIEGIHRAADAKAARSK